LVSELGLRTRMLVKDVMSSPVVTTDEEAPSNKISNIIAENNLGCVIVTNKDGKPLGIITKRDLVVRVMAKNLKPAGVKAKDIMTAPLASIEPEATISDAARRMSRLDIRRLGVIYKGDLIGVISSKDILNVMPELMETIQEKTRLENAGDQEEGEEAPLSGYCDQCGTYAENLEDKEGQYLCENCRSEAENEK
jgi:CBS domain-containing protein